MINACSVASIFHGTDEHLASWLDGDAPYDSVYFSFISRLCNRKSERMHVDDSYWLDRREFSEQPHTLDINIHTYI